MLLEFCHNKGLNFGDDLNKWLWPRLIPECLAEDDGWVFLGIGTVLTERRNRRLLQKAKGIVVLSSGSWGDESCPRPDHRWNIYGVRGPETARRMGLGDDKVVGDGAYLLAQYFFSDVTMRQGAGFIPHHRSEGYIDWAHICDLAGVRFISPRQPVESFMAQVGSCEMIISEAMHGAIAADVLRVPWCAVSYAPNFREDKWRDWGAGMRLMPDFHALPPVYNQMISVGRAFENRTKRFVARIGMGPQKWSSLPVSRRKALDEDLEVLAGAISDLKKVPGQLSAQTEYDKVSDRLLKAVAALRKDFHERKIGG